MSVAWDSTPGFNAGPPKRIGNVGSTDLNEGSTVERHLETTNVLFCDGHVKSMKMDALTQVGTAINGNAYWRFWTPRED